MAIEVIYFPLETDEPVDTQATTLKVGESLFMADHGSNPLKLIFVTCNQMGVGEMHTVELEGIDPEATEVEIDPENFQEILDSQQSITAVIGAGKKHGEVLTDHQGITSAVLIRNIGNTSLRSKLN